MPYLFTVGEKQYRTDDLLLDEAIAIEKLTGRSWVEINPLRSAQDCRAILKAFWARDVGEDEAEKKVVALTVRAVLDHVQWVTDDLPEVYEDGIPKAAAGSATDGLSPVPVNSAGLPT